MFYARSGGYPDDVEASVSRKQRAVDNKESPEGDLPQPDNSVFAEATVLPLKATYTPVPEPQHIPGLASPAQPPSPVDATSLYAFALGTFPTSLLLFIVLRGTRGRDNRAPNSAPAIPVTVTTYLDLVDRQQASMSPQFTDGEYTDSLFSQSTLPSPRPDDEPLDPRDPAAPQAPGIPSARHNPREGFLGEWEAAFVSSLASILLATHLNFSVSVTIEKSI